MNVRPCAAYALADVHGAHTVLQPRGTGLSAIGMDDEAAQIYGAAARGLPVSTESPVTQRLLADRALEVSHRGHYVSGAAYLAAMPDGLPGIASAELDLLSLNALRHLDAFGTTSMGALTRKLYSYNRIPFAGQTRRLVSTPESVPALCRHAAPGYEVAEDSAWTRFRLPTADRAHLAKLYVSPGLPDFEKVAVAATELFAARGVDMFKLARTPEGLCRPDKFVAYFALPSQALDVAAELAEVLSGRYSSTQPVPFATSLTRDGLIAMGYVPPAAAERALRRPLSWRAWICQRLATATLTARSAPHPNCPSIRFALTRLLLDGVDPRTWKPL